MRKNFSLTQPGKADARVRDAVKHDVRKYVKRERRKSPAPDFDTWDFDCKVGADATTAESKDLGDVSAAIDAVASTGAKSVYVEILAKPSRRAMPSRGSNDSSPAPQSLTSPDVG
jgi:hypothetical protein